MSMTKKQIKQRTKFWQKKMGLDNWDIVVVFKNWRWSKDEESFKGVARTQAESSYKIGTITFVPKYLNQIEDQVIIHELLHCLMSGFVGFCNANLDRKLNSKVDDWSTYFEEQTISELERVIYRLYKNKNTA